VLLVAVCAAGVAASIVTYQSQDRLKAAFGRFLVTQDFHVALRQVRASDSVLFPSVYRDVGVAVSLLKTGHGAEGERVMAASARRSPGDVRTWVTLARIQVTRHRLAAARASYARARALNPTLRKQELPVPY
jgi:predicted Zn-dependent protease